MSLRILGAGSPVVDLLVRVDDAFLRDHVAGEKGGRMLLKPEEFSRLLALLPAPPERVPGGSAGNTVFALAKMGIPAALLGKLGRDEAGEFYCRAWKNTGTSHDEFQWTSAAPTGCCLSLITPDAERTMRSCLGASLLLTEQEIRSVDFSRYDLVHLEGYMLPMPEFAVLLKAAKAADCRISLDLASFEIVRQYREELAVLLKQYVDILFANQQEAAELLPGLALEEQLDVLSSWTETAVIKLGRRGAAAAHGAERIHVPAQLVEHPVDTTAAGDLWAAGFFCGLSEGLPLKECAELGSVFAGEVVQVTGSVLPDAAWKRIRQKFAAWKEITVRGTRRRPPGRNGGSACG